MTEEPKHSTAAEDPPDPMAGGDELSGLWEKKGRSPVTAALAVLLVLGSMYFLLQSILLAALQISYEVFNGAEAVAGEGVLQRITRTMEAMSEPIRAALLITQWGVFLFPVFWFVRRAHSQDASAYLKFRGAPASHTLLASAVTLSLIPASAAFSSWTSRLLEIPKELEELGASLYTASSLPELAWVLLVIAVTPAVCEETLFRGYVQRTLSRVIGWKSVLLVGLVFGLFHFQPLGLLPLALLGVLFGFFYHRSESIVPAVAGHFTNNAAVVLLYYFARGDGVVRDLLHDGFPATVTAGATLAAALLFAVYERVSRPSPAGSIPPNRSSEEGECPS